MKKPIVEPFQFGLSSLLGLMLVIIAALTLYRHSDSLFVLVVVMLVGAAGVAFCGIELAKLLVRHFFKNPWD